jgi:putative transposase
LNLKAYKYRIYPNKTQEVKLSKSFGCVRFLWNNNVAKFNIKENINLMPLKSEYPFLNEVSCGMLQQKQRDFIEYKKQFFSKKRKKSIGRPKFKKKGQHDSFRLPNQKFHIKDNKIQLEKIGKIRIILDREIPTNSKFISVTVSKNNCNQYFASVLVEQEIEQKSKTDKIVGCDIGLKSFLVTSDNEIYKPNKYFSKSQAKVKKLSKSLSKKQKGSNRRRKAKLKLSKLHNKIKNQRDYYLHNITTKLVNDYDVIVIEDLNVSGMIKNRKLSKSISDSSFSMFRNMLDYKCNWYGKELVIADRFFPSTKLCSVCGNKKEKMSLSERTYKCECCGSELDRDLNAAYNLKAVGVTTAKCTRRLTKTPYGAQVDELCRIIDVCI